MFFLFFSALTWAQGDTSIVTLNQALSKKLTSYESQLKDIDTIIKTQKTLTDNSLRVYRQELLALSNSLTKQQENYLARLDRAKKLIKEFDDITDIQLSSKNKLAIKPDAYYLTQIRYPFNISMI